MRSIAVINQKGGVGKTTTAVNLSAALADMGQRVFLIDLDPQAHASLHLGLALDEGEPSIYDVLTKDAPISAVRRQVEPNLWIAPSHLDLAAAEMELAGEVGREIILRDKLAESTNVSGADGALEFDYLIIDCPPSLGVLTLNALTSVNEVFLPLQSHFLALHGMGKLLRTIQLVAKRLNRDLRLTGVLMCMYESGTRLAAEVDRDVREFFDQHAGDESVWREAKTFQSKIRRNIRLAEAPSFGQSILQYSPSSNGAEDYRRLAAEVHGDEVTMNESTAAKSAIAGA
jgi:chromosome partitioning protein